MSILKNLRKAIKVIGLLDALIDEFERESVIEQAEKDRARQRMSEIYKEASNLAGKN